MSELKRRRAWVARIAWESAEGVVHPQHTYMEAESECKALEAAASTVLNNCQRPAAMVWAVGAAVQRDGGGGAWRVIET